MCKREKYTERLISGRYSDPLGTSQRRMAFVGSPFSGAKMRADRKGLPPFFILHFSFFIEVTVAGLCISPIPYAEEGREVGKTSKSRA